MKGVPAEAGRELLLVLIELLYGVVRPCAVEVHDTGALAGKVSDGSKTCRALRVAIAICSLYSVARLTRKSREAHL